MNLSALDNETLLRHAQVDFDPLTGTALEAELLKRFEELLDLHRELQPGVDLLNNHGVDPEKTKDIDRLRDALAFAENHELDKTNAVLDVLGDYDMHDPDALRKVLERDAQVRNFITDLAEPLASLQALVTQE